MRSMMLCAAAVAASMTLTVAADSQTVLRLGHVAEVG